MSKEKTQPPAGIHEVHQLIQMRQAEITTLQRIMEMQTIFNPATHLQTYIQRLQKTQLTAAPQLTCKYIYRHNNLPPEQNQIMAYEYRLRWDERKLVGGFYYDSYTGHRLTVRIGQLPQGVGIEMYGGGTVNDIPRPDTVVIPKYFPYQFITQENKSTLEIALSDAFNQSAWHQKGTIRPPIRI